MVISLQMIFKAVGLSKTSWGRAESGKDPGCSVVIPTCTDGAEKEAEEERAA